MAAWTFLGALLTLSVTGTVGESCGPQEYNVKTLTSIPYWWFPTSESNCLNTVAPVIENGTNSTIITSQNCIILFTLCNSLPVLCPNQGVCQTVTSTNTKDAYKLFTWPVRMGTTDYDGFKFEIGEHAFGIEYRKGDKYKCLSMEPGPLRTLITFRCDKKAVWNATLTSNNTPFTGAARAPQPEFIIKEGCMYNIVFNSSEGCRDYGPGGSPGKALSTGSILLILFFPSVFLYCVIGAMVNGNQGKSGREVIPNVNFWSDLPYLILDGFAFIVSIITCSKMTSTRANAYQTM